MKNDYNFTAIQMSDSNNFFRLLNKIKEDDNETLVIDIDGTLLYNMKFMCDYYKFFTLEKSTEYVIEKNYSPIECELIRQSWSLENIYDYLEYNTIVLEKIKSYLMNDGNIILSLNQRIKRHQKLKWKKHSIRLLMY